MKRGMLIFFLVCAVAAAMVPRIRRSQPAEDVKPVQYCADTTPCAWSIYSPAVKLIEMNITNGYCICEKPKTCLVYEDDTTGSAWVYRCMLKEKES